MGSTRSLGGARLTVSLALLALLVVVLFAVAAQPADAYSGYRHSSANSCTSCHPGGDTSVPLTDANCTSCHTGGFASRQTAGAAARTCWTCHEPGQDMATVQGVGCGTAASGVDCHNTTAHFGSSTLTCTSCHGVVQSGTNPGTSAHHGQTDYTAPATCTDCHTPANGLHTDFVTGLSCTTCHGGYDTAHPDPAAVTPPTVVLSAKPLIVKFGLTTILAGSVKTGTTGAVGKTVTLQAKPAGNTDFATVVDTTTTTGGVYTFVAQSPAMFTTYRVVTQGGLVSTTVVKPALKTVAVKVRPDLTIALSRTKFLLGGSLAIKGKLNPARTGGKVKLTIQKKVGTSWKTKLTKSVALTAGSGYTAYSFTYKPPKLASSRGSWRVKASIAATAELAAYTTAYKTWVVK